MSIVLFVWEITFGMKGEEDLKVEYTIVLKKIMVY